MYFQGHLRADTMEIPASTVTNAAVSPSAAITRTKLAQESLAIYPVDFAALRVWNNLTTPLPSAATADDLGLYVGTFGTNAPRVATGDLKAAGATTMYTRFQVPLPPEYQDGETVVIRISCGMETTVADTTATIDVECYEIDRVGGIGSDLCATAAQSINSTTYAEKSFTITASGLAAGDMLDVRVAVAVNDGGTGTAVEGSIGAVDLQCDIKG